MKDTRSLTDSGTSPTRPDLVSLVSTCVGLVISIALITLAADVFGVEDQTEGLGRVQSVYFETTCQMPVNALAPEHQAMVKPLRWTMGKIPEGTQLVSAIGLLSKQFGLSPRQATELRAEFSEAYTAMETDPQCVELPSALGEVLATDAQREGHYFVYVPAKPAPSAPTLLFLHGYGGNLKFYIWALKEAFPKSVILAPSWGISWHNGPANYVDEVCRDAKSRFNIAIEKKWLMALSAGGPAGFRLMNSKSSDYQGYICLASGLPPQRVADLSFVEPVLMLNGANDVRFPIQFVRKGIGSMKSKGIAIEQVELDADHFFLLTQRAKTLKMVDAFIEKHSVVEDMPNAHQPQRLSNFFSPWGLACLCLSGTLFVGFLFLRFYRWNKPS